MDLSPELRLLLNLLMNEGFFSVGDFFPFFEGVEEAEVEGEVVVEDVAEDDVVVVVDVVGDVAAAAVVVVVVEDDVAVVAVALGVVVTVVVGAVVGFGIFDGDVLSLPLGIGGAGAGDFFLPCCWGLFNGVTTTEEEGEDSFSCRGNNF